MCWAMACRTHSGNVLLRHRGRLYVRPQAVLTDARGLATCTCYVHVPVAVTLLASAQGVAEPARFEMAIVAAGSPYDGAYLVTGGRD